MKEQYKKESPILSMLGMGGGGTGTALGGLATIPKYVDDGFQQFSYLGNNSSRSIPNKIDFSGNAKALVWTKRRDSTNAHIFVDTVNGGNRWLEPGNANALDGPNSSLITSFGSNGYNLGSFGAMNGSGEAISFTFKQQEGFFTIITWAGDGNGDRYIDHDLGTVPGSIIVRRIEGGSWGVYHRSLGTAVYGGLTLNEKYQSGNNANAINPARSVPTATQMHIRGGSNEYNTSGSNYIAYIFAHDDATFGMDGDKAAIKCGTYTGNGGSQEISLGFEPQWLLMKNATDDNIDWRLWTIMDGWHGGTTSGQDSKSFEVDTTGVLANSHRCHPTPNGFRFQGEGAGACNGSGKTYVYWAIARSQKPPSAGTEVFQNLNYSGSSGDIRRSVTVNPIDVVHSNRTNGGVPYFLDRIRLNGVEYIATNGDNASGEQSAGLHDMASDYLQMDNGAVINGGNTYILQCFSRRAGFFDEIYYTGSGVEPGGSVINHSLGVAPELVIVKPRDNASFGQWRAYLPGEDKYATLNTGGAFVNNNGNFGPMTKSTVNFKYTGTDQSGVGYFAYLFASLAGVSKVGTYTTSSATTVNVDCGFDPRFILIKRKDTSADWRQFDSTQGISSGSDSHMIFNANSAQQSADLVDPISGGFSVPNSGNTDIHNGNGGSASYLFLAIA
jgi:hypothetical protein